MRYPWVNVLLLVLLPVALASGYFGLTNGDPGRRWILWTHATVAYAAISVAAWKWAVVERAVHRRPRVEAPRVAFLGMGLLALVVFATGVLWAYAGRLTLTGYSLLTIHEVAGALLGGLFVWHVVARRSVFRIRRSRDRRAFLRLVLAGTAGLLIWQGSTGVSRLLGLPGANRRFTGSYETGSFTGVFPTVSWLFDDPDPVDRSAWRLVIDGAVDEPLALDLKAVEQLASTTRTVTIDCTGGWYSEQEWTGVPLRDLLAAARTRRGASSVTITSITGYSRRFSLGEAGDALLALAVGNHPLRHGHGAPARLVIPGHRGFDWVKWVSRITVNRSRDLWQPPLPLQ